MNMAFVDLLMDNGELTRIECPDKHYDELYESLDSAMKIGEWWSPSRFDGCTATYLGHSVSRISMKKVVGTL